MEVRDRTAIAHRETVCLVINKIDFAEKTFQVENQKKQDRLQYLLKHQLCEGWDHLKVTDLNSLMTQQSYNVNDIIYERGEQPDYVYILLKGALSMTTIVHMSDVN